MDNAPIHSAPEALKAMERLRMKIALTAPYSFSSSPCELVFAAIKRGELNPNNLKTGKRNLADVNTLIHAAVEKIPRA